ncbi:MAG: thymidine kinase, partial [Planctomycetes bacterium]|nr:thymidine kinase [Planctomycetota bacterium]
MSNSKIELITGCMFSGKTTELIDRINALAPGTKIVTLKPAIDDRYSNTDLVTHNGRTAQARTVEHSNEIAEQAGEAEVVVIDEIHFFDDAIVETCQQLARRGVRVI